MEVLHVVAQHLAKPAEHLLVPRVILEVHLRLDLHTQGKKELFTIAIQEIETKCKLLQYFKDFLPKKNTMTAFNISTKKPFWFKNKK